jgi:hypothetical protein
MKPAPRPERSSFFGLFWGQKKARVEGGIGAQIEKTIRKCEITFAQANRSCLVMTIIVRKSIKFLVMTIIIRKV